MERLMMASLLPLGALVGPAAPAPRRGKGQERSAKATIADAGEQGPIAGETPHPERGEVVRNDAVVAD